MGDEFDSMTVAELRTFLDSKSLDYSGYREKTELVQLARGLIPPSAASIDPFLTSQFGTASALFTEFEMKVKSWSIKQLKAHLDTLGISYSGIFEKEALIQLVLEGSRDKTVHALKADFSEPSESILEC
jgi:hypothetical protein